MVLPITLKSLESILWVVSKLFTYRWLVSCSWVTCMCLFRWIWAALHIQVSYYYRRYVITLSYPVCPEVLNLYGFLLHWVVNRKLEYYVSQTLLQPLNHTLSWTFKFFKCVSIVDLWNTDVSIDLCRDDQRCFFLVYTCTWAMTGNLWLQLFIMVSFSYCSVNAKTMFFDNKTMSTTKNYNKSPVQNPHVLDLL